MSGTSLDGIDMSILTTNGINIFEFGPNHFTKFSKELNEKLFEALNLNDRISLQNKFINDLNVLFSEEYSASILEFIKNTDVELIGLHGQTIYHDPKNKISIQLGDGQLISNYLNKKLIYNMRKNDLSHNGQGAPIAPIYHKLIMEDLNLCPPSCILNIGGISNITYWDHKDLIGFDTGPGNSIINDLMFKFFNQDYDKDGKTAFRGKILNKLINQIMADNYFKVSYPKSLDRQHFNRYLRNIKKYRAEDIIATFSEFTALSISNSLKLLPHYPKSIIIMGGGSKNLYIRDRLKKHLKCNIIQQNSTKYHPDFIESQLMGFLAVRSINNLPYTFPLTTGVSKPLSGGELCIPKETH